MPQATVFENLNTKLTAMKQAQLTAGPADLSLRRDRLERALHLLRQHYSELATAISDDFCHRSTYQTLLADVQASMGSLHYAHESIEQWMQDEEVVAPVPGVQARINYQPLGVVGIISPWNFPVSLAFSPLASIFAAGNRALLKPSELTPKTAELLQKLIAQYFDPLEFDVVLGDASVGAAFSGLPFDHLIFTGSTNVGHHVMRAAAENLVPVTLELGGKSPVFIDENTDIQRAIERILTAKTFNAGQICVSPDYVLLPEAACGSFVSHAKQFVASILPAPCSNPDYTSIISDRHYQRLLQLIDDARTKGATVIHLVSEGQSYFDNTVRKLAPTLVLNVTDDMLVMKEEIFGPILPILTYTNAEQAISYINSHERPLAAYYFGDDAQRQQNFSKKTTSGALVINDIMTHMAIENLPFGGVGHSGMGAYHGIHGFRRFSHAKALVVQSPMGEINLAMRAPYADKLSLIENMLRG